MREPTVPIRVSRSLERFIREQGRMGDTHDTVLRRLVGFEESAPADERPSRMRAARGSVTPEEFFVPFVLRALAHGRAMRAGEVLREIGPRVKPHLKPSDLEETQSGAVRWANKAQWARRLMVERELLEPVSAVGHGVWKLTPKGRAEAGKLEAPSSRKIGRSAKELFAEMEPHTVRRGQVDDSREAMYRRMEGE